MDISQPTDGPAIDQYHLQRQIAFSLAAFGPGRRTEQIIRHIAKELREIEDSSADVNEWADVVILALDGAWRAGHSPHGVLNAIVSKQHVNEQRQWPNWRTVPAGTPIEHIPAADTSP